MHAPPTQPEFRRNWRRFLEFGIGLVQGPSSKARPRIDGFSKVDGAYLGSWDTIGDELEDPVAAGRHAVIRGDEHAERREFKPVPLAKMSAGCTSSRAA